MKHLFSGVATVVTAASLIQAYSLSREYKGQDFIDYFNYWDDALKRDPTGSPAAPSAALYTHKDAAQSQGLVRVNEQGHFVLSVDSTSTYSGDDRRPSVRINSTDPIQYGLLILDAVHVPYGRGTWPAFWLKGADGKWPYSGEIDIIEGVGNSAGNTISYHTGPGICSYDPSARQTAQLNATAGTDCSAFESNDMACSNSDPDPSSYGSGANKAGGGVWAVEWTTSSIKTWHFKRKDIPSDITKGSPVPSRWGTPVTNLASTGCGIDAAFGPQSIIFNIELCGNWEGYMFDGGPSACFSYVQQNPDAFKTAYFEISHLRYYQRI